MGEGKIDKVKLSQMLRAGKPQKEIAVIFQWDIDNNVDLSYMSYKKAVNWLKAEYKKRYELIKQNK